MGRICFSRELTLTTGRYQQHEITRVGQLVGSAPNTVQGKGLPWLLVVDMPGKFILNDLHEALFLKGILTNIQKPKTAPLEPNGTALQGQDIQCPRQRFFTDLFAEGQNMETVAHPEIPQPYQGLLLTQDMRMMGR